MEEKELTGLTSSHIRVFRDPNMAVRFEAGNAFIDMRRAAAKDGIEIYPVSTFRGFNDQLSIWNSKFTQKRPIYSDEGKKINISGLSRPEIVKMILKWSALPGGSRHHWGTDIDVVDTKTLPEGYQIKLMPEETKKGGVFYRLHCWLNENMENFGFFRPYARFQNGVCPEPWHISYRPIAEKALSEIKLTMIKNALENSNLKGKREVLNMLPDIYHNFILNISK